MASFDPSANFNIICEDLDLDKLLQDLTENNFEIEPKRDEENVNVENFIEGQKKKNTNLSTERDVRNFQRWLIEHKNEHRLIQNVEVPVLNEYLSEMYISIRKSDGSNYEPSSLEAMKNSIERHLKDHAYPVSLRDRLFHKSNKALAAKKQQLKSIGTGRNSYASEALTEDDENALLTSGEISFENPSSLQFGVFYYFGKYFALRGRNEQRKLKFGDVQEKKDGSENNYLEFHERSSKTMDGTGKKDYRMTTPRIFSPNSGPPEKDPIALYREFVRRRPEEAKREDSPMYLTPIPMKILLDSSLIW
ncbi:uncharacterized protein KIAA1958-like [Ostrea edulis]|uniref:uncharacterized protein KIAA1958-like n=1 Tax=Ostrea edulis TaxID=37623 RepID=UPI0024AED91D|nr:uncharacterized protein KIAA1958-like [Ostrea edulis]